MPVFFIVWLFFLGACVASFLGVVADRVTTPGAAPFWQGRSHCPACGATLTAIDLVPVLNWLYLRGKCRRCGAPIPFRCFASEVLGGLAAALPFLCWGWAPGKWAVAFTAGALLLLIALCDAAAMEIPDLFTLLLCLPALGAVWAFPAVGLPARLIGAACVSLPLLAITLLIPGAFGGGDIQLAAVCGFLLGWKAALAGFFLALLLGGGQGVFLLATGRAKRGTGAHMAFGPALCAGFWAALFVGEGMAAWYAGFF